MLTSLDLSANTALTIFECYDNVYEIDLIGGTFDLSKLPEDIENLGMCLTNALTYNGEEQTQLIEVTIMDELLTEGVDYTITGNTATDAGDYTMTITGIGNFTGTYEAPWSIDKANPEASHFTFTPPSDLVYDGTAKEATVTTDAIGMGKFTVIYADTGGYLIDNIPTDAGLYKVGISVEEGDNYYSDDEIWDFWEFTIEKAPEPDINFSCNLLKSML